MQQRWRALAATAILVVTATMSSSAVDAAQSATAGTNKCTVTALAPTLSKGMLTGKASVLCTKATAVTVELGVTELDGTVEDAKLPIAPTAKTVAVTANKAVTVSTAVVACLNTETGNEEFASKARVNISGTVSTWDRTIPKNDAFAC